MANTTTNFGTTSLPLSIASATSGILPLPRGGRGDTTNRTSAYTALTTDGYIVCDATSGSFTVTLYAASGNAGNVITLLRTDSSTNTVTIDGNSSETINGVLSLQLSAQFDRLTLLCTGSNWVILDGLNTSEVFLTGGNGFGSTSTVIRRFTTTLVNRGSAITYADSATLGGTFTINEPGVYSMKYSDGNTLAIDRLGISLNSTELTTGINAISNSTRLAQDRTSAANDFENVFVSRRLRAGDVIRAHTLGSNNMTADDIVTFSIIKVSC